MTVKAAVNTVAVVCMVAQVMLAPVLLVGLVLQSLCEWSARDAWAWAGSNDWFGPAVVGWAILAMGYLEVAL